MVEKSGQEDQKTKGSVRKGFPYQNFMDTPEWRVLDNAISDLVHNNDIRELTTRGHIVGYLCKKLADNNRES